MKLQKFTLLLVIVLTSALSHGQLKSTYSFKKVQKKNLVNGAVTGEENIGDNCTLIISKQEGIYTFSYENSNNLHSEIRFKISKKRRTITATIIGDDDPQKISYNVTNYLDTKGIIEFVPNATYKHAFTYTFLNHSN
ncbi:MAG: hypothetical protein GKR88_05910 [Flavobacteriaceae bacterium]|nr:MAG: hypothetical protein GKR88_05910 [Flavobacteriaceae bacterium]